MKERILELFEVLKYKITRLFYGRLLSAEELLILMINKELKPYKVDFEYVKANPKINEEFWFTHYSFNSEKEFETWKKYCIKLLIKKGNFTEYGAKKEFAFIDLCYGLRINYDYKR